MISAPFHVSATDDSVQRAVAAAAAGTAAGTTAAARAVVAAATRAIAAGRTVMIVIRLGLGLAATAGAVAAAEDVTVREVCFHRRVANADRVRVGRVARRNVTDGRLLVVVRIARTRLGIDVASVVDE